MSAKTLELLFPQWQGSSLADPRGLFTGAKRLRELFPNHNFAEIAVHPEEKREARGGVLAHAAVAKHLAQARELLEKNQPERVLTVGGDCSVDIAPVTYLNEHYDNLAVLWLDAHPDLNTPESSPSGALHGMVLRLLLGEGDEELLDVVETPLEPRQVLLLGARDFDSPERAFAQVRGLEHVSVSELEEKPEQVVESLRAGGFDKLHLHFDLDVLNPEAFAATGYPTENGLSLAGATKLLALLGASFEVVGLTLTEYLPQAGRNDREREVLQTLLEALPKL